MRSNQEEESAAEMERRPFFAYLMVWSKTRPLTQITAAIGIDPDESHDIGDNNPYRDSGVYRYSMWQKYLVLDDHLPLGTEALSEAIEAFDDELADRLNELASGGCEVVVEVVQYFDDEDDEQEGCDTGLHLTAPAIAWIARAGALVDVDQYP